MSELHDDAAAFVLCAAADNTVDNQTRTQELSLFLISLINMHKKGQLTADPFERCEPERGEPIKIEQAARPICGGHRVAMR